MKGSVYQRGKTWTYRFPSPDKDLATGTYPTISKGGFSTEKEAWKACREAMRDADRGRIVSPSTRTVAQFLAEWFGAVEASLDATTWQNWKDYAYAYVVPRIGEERLQKLNEPQLLKLYSTLLAEGRVKRDRNTEMFRYWSACRKGRKPGKTSRGFRSMWHDDPRGADGATPLQIGDHPDRATPGLGTQNGAQHPRNDPPGPR